MKTKIANHNVKVSELKTKNKLDVTLKECNCRKNNE